MIIYLIIPKFLKQQQTKKVDKNIN